MADVESVRIIVKDDDDAEAALTNFVVPRMARSSALTDGTGALRRQSFAHLPLRKQILLRIQQSLAEECGLAGGLVVNRAAEAVVKVKMEAVDPLTCQFCAKRFNSISKHNSHELRHRSKNDGRYRCTKCGKCFVQKSSLVTHVRSHTGERPYCCTLCGAKFGDVSCYNKHKRIHSGDRPYTCFACDKAFTQSGNLYRHMRCCALVKDKSPNLS
ncbi:zinc finger protein 675-like [Rhipicephalus sanguineus]|uniref:zinc finger protein 675-like n=1 Tax=Rhipicephalus sanguineus TaxID=34632 RepID=UPI00189312DC|nr:zinc finger protein 675-like [Rhipicephalus sanguineus]